MKMNLKNIYNLCIIKYFKNCNKMNEDKTKENA